MPTTLTMADALRDIAAAARMQPQRAGEPKGAITTAEYAAHIGRSSAVASREIGRMQQAGTLRFAGKVMRPSRTGELHAIPAYTLVTKGK